MSLADTLRDRIWFSSLALESLRDHWHLRAGRTIHPLNLAAALEQVGKSRDELARLDSDHPSMDEHGTINDE
jgi:hypothetical protein